MSETPQLDLAIIGGGAAGLAAAIFAASHARELQQPVNIAILDSAKTLGAKILVAGGGRCNVTHETVTPRDYQGPSNRVKKILAAFTVKQTIAWFADMGVTLKREDTGKLFPTTDQARTVLTALTDRCRSLNVALLTDHRVAEIYRDQTHGFDITHNHGRTRAAQVILATGGCSLPRSGSDGQGFKLARGLGHDVTKLYPALVPLMLDDHFFHAGLSGISHEVTLTTKVAGKRIDQRTGSMLWTRFGVSGPVVMDASRFVTLAMANGKVELRCNLLPTVTFDAMENYLLEKTRAHPTRTISRLIGEHPTGLPRRVVEAVCNHAGADANQVSSQSPRELRRSLVHALTDLPLPVLRDRGWNYAEVTAGGVPLEQVDTATMRSRCCPGLYLVGEILDVDGRIGGFNFQWAWATGHLAGTHVTQSRE